MLTDTWLQAGQARVSPRRLEWRAHRQRVVGDVSSAASTLEMTDTGSATEPPDPPEEYHAEGCSSPIPGTTPHKSTDGLG